MTRKDFQLIADTLSDLAEECPDHRYAFTLATTAFLKSSEDKPTIRPRSIPGGMRRRQPEEPSHWR